MLVFATFIQESGVFLKPTFRSISFAVVLCMTHEFPGKRLFFDSN